MSSEKIILAGEKRRIELKLRQLDMEASVLVDDIRSALIREVVADLSELPVEIARQSMDKLYGHVLAMRELRGRLAQVEAAL